MPTNTLNLLGRLGSEAALRDPSVCNVELSITGDRYMTSIVAVRMNRRPFLDTTQPLFQKFCGYARGKPARKWLEVMVEPEMNQVRLTMPVEMSTVEQNLLKACFLVYLWIEPLFVGRPTGPLDTSLTDECIIDYTGATGIQPFLYFPPGDYQRRVDDSAMTKLFELQLVCRLQADVAGQALTRWFTPLVIPGVLVDRFGNDPIERRINYQTWQGIKAHLQGAVERTFRRRG